MPFRRPPQLPPERAAATEQWYDALREHDPDDAQTVLWRAIALVTDVAGAPREAVYCAHAKPNGSEQHRRLRDWLCYALDVSRQSTHRDDAAWA